MKTNLIHVGSLVAAMLCCADCACAEETDLATACNWPYRRVITLQPPTVQANTVVSILLTTDVLGNPYSHFNADGSDIRFTAPDGRTPLGYWIENWKPTGQSKIWVKVPEAGTKTIQLHFGNTEAGSCSDGRRVFDFFDDFNDGIWTKHPGNPVMTRTEPWEARCICEPSVICEDGTFKMWFMGCETSAGNNAALGYATSKDGFVWEKYPHNPILREPGKAIIRTTVIKQRDTYYLFASDYQWNDAAGVINRWTSKDGLRWVDKTTVLRPNGTWEKHFHNVHVIVDDDGTWKMLYTTDGPFGYAHSRDGLHWTKHETPVITGFYGGDPYLKKIGDDYYIWHSREHNGHLRIYCRRSTDMIHWRGIHNDPQLGYTQPWERGVGRPEVHWDRHLADAELIEHDGRVLVYYGGAQCPLGVAVFDGTFDQLAARLAAPPLSQWAETHYGCVDGKQLRISDNDTDAAPLCENVRRFSDRERYVLQFRARCYAGATHRAHAVVRYVDEDNFARFWLHDNHTTYYQERVAGAWMKPVDVGANGACDGAWHEWRVEVDGHENRLVIDGRRIGAHKSGQTLSDRTDLRIGFSAHETYASFDDVRVSRGSFSVCVEAVGIEQSHIHADIDG